MVQICDVQADVSDFGIVHPRGIQGDRPVLVGDVQVANLDTLCCVRQSHVKRGCLVKGRGVAVENCHVLVGGIQELLEA